MVMSIDIEAPMHDLCFATLPELEAPYVLSDTDAA